MFNSYIRIITSSNEIFKTNEGFIFSERPLSFYLLNLIRNFKEEVFSNYNSDKIFNFLDTNNYDQISFGKYNKNLLSLYDKNVEVRVLDLKSAYLQAYYYFHLISDETYKKLLSIKKKSKKLYLKVMGSIAIRKIIEYYENGKLVKKDVIKNEEGQRIWDAIQGLIIRTMENCYTLNENYSLYYWVDEICFLKEANDSFIYDLNGFKYEVKEAVFDKEKFRVIYKDKEKDFSFLFHSEF